MNKIATLCDRTACSFIDPINPKYFNKSTRLRVVVAAVAAAVFYEIEWETALIVLGTVYVTSLAWKRLRKIQDKNETLSMIGQLFVRQGPSNPGGGKPSFTRTPVQPKSSSINSLSASSPSQPPVRLMFKQPPKPIAVDTKAILEGPLQQFSSADLLTFKTALQKNNEPVEITVNGVDYVVWYSVPSMLAGMFSRTPPTINIQDKNNYSQKNQDNKLVITIADGKASSPHPAIPEHYLPMAHAGFKKALEISSSYTKSVDKQGKMQIIIQVIRRGLKTISRYHLEHFSDLLKARMQVENKPHVSVSFLEDDLTVKTGIDASGLSRDYLDDLFAALTVDGELSFQQAQPSMLLLPSTKQKPKPDDEIPPINEQERRGFEQIGSIMMFCYLSDSVADTSFNSYTTGRHFDDALFKAVLCLSSEEINTSFDQLRMEPLLRICEALAEARANAEDGMKAQLTFIKTLMKTYPSDQELLNIAQTAQYLDYLPDDYQTNGEPDIKKIKANREAFLLALTKGVVFEAWGFGSLLAPIHAVAKGMLDVCEPTRSQLVLNQGWDNGFYASAQYVMFSNKIQGSVDRKEIADAFHISAHLDEPQKQAVKAELSKKLTWLQEWIINSATEEEVKHLLKFLTASSSLPKGRTISVEEQSNVKDPYTPLPRAHTCFFFMEFAPISARYGSLHDRTKEGFIQCIKVTIADPTSYHMD